MIKVHNLQQFSTWWCEGFGWSDGKVKYSGQKVDLIVIGCPQAMCGRFTVIFF